MQFKRLVVLILLLAFSVIARCGELAGLWEQFGEHGNPSALIRIMERPDAFYEGRVEKVFPEVGEPENPLCSKCSGELHDQPVVGMRILFGLQRKSADLFEKGRILDPDDGKVYNCSMRIHPDGKHLEVKGFIGVSWLGRTETWLRVE